MRRHDTGFSASSPFARVLTDRTEWGESPGETRDNGRVQTFVCGKTKGGRIMDVAARPGRDADCGVRRHPGRGCRERTIGRGRGAALLADRGEGTR
jgi:hypothetical protein